MKHSSADLERIAMMQYMIRPMMRLAFKRMPIASDQRHVAGAEDMWDFFEHTFGDRFFDATTMIRLGTSIETALRDCYMRKANLPNLSALQSAPNYRNGCFQRIGIKHVGPHDAARWLSAVGVTLDALPSIREAREIMLHRHLYAHSAGVLDDEYIDAWKALTGEDLLADAATKDALKVDTYWFRPVTLLGEYIEHIRRLVAALA